MVFRITVTQKSCVWWDERHVTRLSFFLDVTGSTFLYGKIVNHLPGCHCNQYFPLVLQLQQGTYLLIHVQVRSTVHRGVLMKRESRRLGKVGKVHFTLSIGSAFDDRCNIEMTKEILSSTTCGTVTCLYSLPQSSGRDVGGDVSLHEKKTACIGKNKKSTCCLCHGDGADATRAAFMSHTKYMPPREQPNVKDVHGRGSRKRMQTRKDLPKMKV